MTAMAVQTLHCKAVIDPPAIRLVVCDGREDDKELEWIVQVAQALAAKHPAEPDAR